MPHDARSWFFVAISVVGLGTAHAVERSEVPEKYRWDLSALHADEAARATARPAFLESNPAVVVHQGKTNSIMDEIERIYARGAVR